MSATILTFGASSAIARVNITSNGWRIDCTSSAVRRSYHFAMEGDTAELARALRSEGGWTLRFGPGAEGVKRLVADLDRGGAA